MGAGELRQQGESDERAGRPQSVLLLSTNPLCVCLCQLGLSLGMIAGKGSRLFFFPLGLQSFML